MKLHVEDTVPFPIDQVFAARRDRLEELAVYMPNVDRISVKSAGRGPFHVDLETVWTAAWDKIPTMVKAAGVKPDALAWMESGRFDQRKTLHTWSISLLAMPNALDATGTDTYTATELPNGKPATRIIVDGQFALKLDSLPLPVPAALVKGIQPQIESFFLGIIETSMHQTHQAIGQLLTP